MIIFLYGRDGYRLKENLEKIVGAYRKKHTSGMGFSVLDFSDGDQTGKLADLIKTKSFFDEKRLIILKSAFGWGRQIEGLIKDWSLISDQSLILVFSEDNSAEELAKKDKKFFALLTAEPNVAKLFEPLSGKKLNDWISKTALALGIKLELPALKKLTDFVGNDSWRLKEELVKLANYSLSGGQASVSHRDVELLIRPKIDLNIFNTVDAIGNRDKAKAAILLQKHLDGGDDPYYLFSMIVYQFRNLLRVKSLLAEYPSPAAIVKRTGLHPFVVRKMTEQSRKFELEELKQRFSKLAEADLAIKNGAIDIVDSLFQIVLS